MKSEKVETLKIEKILKDKKTEEKRFMLNVFLGETTNKEMYFCMHLRQYRHKTQ